jgi:hypothetical protein
MQVVDFCNQMEKQLASFETSVADIEKGLMPAVRKSNRRYFRWWEISKIY